MTDQNICMKCGVHVIDHGPKCEQWVDAFCVEYPDRTHSPPHSTLYSAKNSRDLGDRIRKIRYNPATGAEWLGEYVY